MSTSTPSESFFDPNSDAARELSELLVSSAPLVPPADGQPVDPGNSTQAEAPYNQTDRVDTIIMQGFMQINNMIRAANPASPKVYPEPQFLAEQPHTSDREPVTYAEDKFDTDEEAIPRQAYSDTMSAPTLIATVAAEDEREPASSFNQRAGAVASLGGVAAGVAILAALAGGPGQPAPVSKERAVAPATSPSGSRALAQAGSAHSDEPSHSALARRVDSPSPQAHSSHHASTKAVKASEAHAASDGQMTHAEVLAKVAARDPAPVIAGHSTTSHSKGATVERVTVTRVKAKGTTTRHTQSGRRTSSNSSTGGATASQASPGGSGGTIASAASKKGASSRPATSSASSTTIPAKTTPAASKVAETAPATSTFTPTPKPVESSPVTTTTGSGSPSSSPKATKAAPTNPETGGASVPPQYPSGGVAPGVSPTQSTETSPSTGGSSIAPSTQEIKQTAQIDEKADQMLAAEAASQKRQRAVLAMAAAAATRVASHAQHLVRKA